MPNYFQTIIGEPEHLLQERKAAYADHIMAQVTKGLFADEDDSMAGIEADFAEIMANKDDFGVQQEQDDLSRGQYDGS